MASGGLLKKKRGRRPVKNKRQVANEEGCNAWAVKALDPISFHQLPPPDPIDPLTPGAGCEPPIPPGPRLRAFPRHLLRRQTQPSAPQGIFSGGHPEIPHRERTFLSASCIQILRPTPSQGNPAERYPASWGRRLQTHCEDAMSLPTTPGKGSREFSF